MAERRRWSQTSTRVVAAVGGVLVGVALAACDIRPLVSQRPGGDARLSAAPVETVTAVEVDADMVTEVP